MGIETRYLGRTGIRVPRLGLGCATFGREVDEATSFALMDHAVESGMNLFDTAEAYGGGQARDYRKNVLKVEDVRETTGEYHSSEKIVGRWLRGNGARDQVVLVSKVTTNFTRQHVREALQASLERLQTNYLDVYMFHSFDPAVPMEQALEAMDEARTSGLIRSAGCSNFAAQQLQDALAVSQRLGLARLEVTEAILNLTARDAETGLLPLCREQEVGFLGYSPLGAGFLSGKYSGDRNALPQGSRFHVIPAHADIYFSERNFQVLQQLRDTADGLGIPPLQLAIAWVLAHPDVTTVLCGARSTAHIDNAVVAANLSVRLEDISGPIPHAST